VTEFMDRRNTFPAPASNGNAGVAHLFSPTASASGHNHTRRRSQD
jgi:hypothetical protein